MHDSRRSFINVDRVGRGVIGFGIDDRFWGDISFFFDRWNGPGREARTLIGGYCDANPDGRSRTRIA